MTTVSRTTAFTVESGSCHGTGVATFRFDDISPTDVRVTFADDVDDQDAVTWLVGRDVLALRVEGLGDVRCRADGLWFHLHLSGGGRTAVLTFVRAQVEAFLRATERLVPFAADLDFGAELDALLKDGAR
jgi:hypothetical protein